MRFEPNADVLDAFLAARHGKFILGATSFLIGILFLLGRRMVTGVGAGPQFKTEQIVKKYEAVVKRDALGLIGFVGVTMGTIYLIWSAIPVH